MIGLVCNGFKIIDLINNLNGLIYSFGYFYLNYGNNENCLWFFIVFYGGKVFFYFIIFEVEDNLVCVYDSVELFDGRGNFFVCLLKSCGSIFFLLVYLFGRYMYM